MCLPSIDDLVRQHPHHAAKLEPMLPTMGVGPVVVHYEEHPGLLVAASHLRSEVRDEMTLVARSERMMLVVSDWMMPGVLNNHGTRRIVSSWTKDLVRCPQSYAHFLRRHCHRVVNITFRTNCMTLGEKDIKCQRPPF